MWRREERLKYWLERGRQSQRPGFASRLIEKLSFKLQLRQGAGAVQEKSLRLNAEAVCLDNALAATTEVKDGFEILGKWTDLEYESVSDCTECGNPIHQITLLESATTVNIRLPDARLARIRQKSATIDSICRQFGLSVRSIEVHELKHPHNQPPQLRDGSRFLIAHPVVQMRTSEISEMPHTRAGIGIEKLLDSERMGFLREAEVLKGIPSDRVELLAVFRHVPIEVISRLSFLAERQTIQYSISRDAKPARTRVHDMAAIRDAASKEIYLIPHRTQFRSVSLN